MDSLSRYLLYLYPAAHRLEFGEEMSAMLRERQNEIGRAGRWRDGYRMGGKLKDCCVARRRSMCEPRRVCIRGKSFR